jgi:hypothetical protein
MDYNFMISLKYIQVDNLVKIFNDLLTLHQIDDQTRRYELLSDFLLDSFTSMKLTKTKKIKLFDFTKSKYSSFADIRNKLLERYDKILFDCNLENADELVSSDEE